MRSNCSLSSQICMTMWRSMSQGLAGGRHMMSSKNVTSHRETYRLGGFWWIDGGCY